MTDNTALALLYPCRSRSCIWKPENDGLSIVHITEHGEPPRVVHTVQRLVVNREGKDTWMLCTGERTMKDITAILEKEYEGDAQTIQKDVITMITQMAEQSYISLEKSPLKAEYGLDKNICPKRKDDVIVNTVEDNFVLMNMVTSEVYSFHVVVKDVWDTCDGTRSVGEIVSAAVNPDETEFFLNFLVKIGFLQLEGG